MLISLKKTFGHARRKGTMQADHVKLISKTYTYTMDLLGRFFTIHNIFFWD